MGCTGSKTAQPQAKGKTNTLLEAPSAEKPSALDSFNILLDGPVPSGCLEVEKRASGAIHLRVVQVEGGPICLWNNRPRTEKVKKGDLAVIVRKDAWQNDGTWEELDEKMISEMLNENRIIELVVRRSPPEADPQLAPSTEAQEALTIEQGSMQANAEAAPADTVDGEGPADQAAADTSGEKVVVEVAEPTPMKIEASTKQVEVSEAEPSSTTGGCRFFC